MVLPKFSNNSYSTLSAGAILGATSLSVVSSSLFPSISAGQHFYVTLWNSTTYPNPGDDTNSEIVKVTGVSGTTLTLESPTTKGHNSGDMVALLLTKNFFDDLESELSSFGPTRIYKTVRFDGELTTANSQQFSVLEANATLILARLVLRGTNATGSTIQVQITKNGASVTDSILTADAPIVIPLDLLPLSNGIYVVNGSLDSNMTSCNINDVFQATIVQVGSTFAGTDLDVQLVFQVV